MPREPAAFACSTRVPPAPALSRPPQGYTAKGSYAQKGKR
jgi:hypothetical protein